jgi:hypothetical protein
MLQCIKLWGYKFGGKKRTDICKHDIWRDFSARAVCTTAQTVQTESHASYQGLLYTLLCIGATAPSGLLIVEASRPHSHKTYTVWLLSPWSGRRRDLYLTTHKTQQTDIHAPSGIRTHNPSKGTAKDSRIRPRGHQYRLFLCAYSHIKVNFISVSIYFQMHTLKFRIASNPFKKNVAPTCVVTLAKDKTSLRRHVTDYCHKIVYLTWKYLCGLTFLRSRLRFQRISLNSSRQYLFLAANTLSPCLGPSHLENCCCTPHIPCNITVYFTRKIALPSLIQKCYKSDAQL